MKKSSSFSKKFNFQKRLNVPIREKFEKLKNLKRQNTALKYENLKKALKDEISG